MPEGRLHLDDYRWVVLAGLRDLPGDGAVAPTAAGHVVTPIKLRLRSRPDLYAEDVRVLDVGDCRYLGMAPGVGVMRDRELPVLLRHAYSESPAALRASAGSEKPFL